MTTAGDWTSAASFISVAGLISFTGYTGCTYLMGWIPPALLLAPMSVSYQPSESSFNSKSPILDGEEFLPSFPGHFSVFWQEEWVFRAESPEETR